MEGTALSALVGEKCRSLGRFLEEADMPPGIKGIKDRVFLKILRETPDERLMASVFQIFEMHGHETDAQLAESFYTPGLLEWMKTRPDVQAKLLRYVAFFRSAHEKILNQLEAWTKQSMERAAENSQARRWNGGAAGSHAAGRRGGGPAKGEGRSDGEDSGEGATQAAPDEAPEFREGSPSSGR
jgi:hypothetical protein